MSNRETRVLSKEEVMFLKDHDSLQTSVFEETFVDETVDENGADENIEINAENIENEDEHSEPHIEEKLRNMAPEEIDSLMDQLQLEEDEGKKNKGKQSPFKKNKKPTAKTGKQDDKLSAPQKRSPSVEEPKQKRGRNKKVDSKEERGVEDANQLPHSEKEEIKQKKGRNKKVETKEQDETDGMTQLPPPKTEEIKEKKGKNKKVEAKQQDVTDGTTQVPPTTSEETKHKKGRNKKPQLKEEDEVKGGQFMEKDEEIFGEEIASEIITHKKRMPKVQSLKVQEDLNIEEYSNQSKQDKLIKDSNKKITGTEEVVLKKTKVTDKESKEILKPAKAKSKADANSDKAGGNKTEINEPETKSKKTTKASKTKQRDAVSNLEENNNPLKKEDGEKIENRNERPKRNIVKKIYVEGIPKAKNETDVKQPLKSQNSELKTQAENYSKANEKVKAPSKKKNVTVAKENEAGNEKIMPEKRATRRQ